MNNHKQFHFIAVLLLAFALSQSLAPVSHAQSDEVTGDSGSDEVDTGTETDGSGSDTIAGGSDDADSGTPATTTGLGATGLEVFQAAGPNPVPPNTEQSIQSGRCVPCWLRGLKQWQYPRPPPFGASRNQLGWRRRGGWHHRPGYTVQRLCDHSRRAVHHAGRRPFAGAACGRAGWRPGRAFQQPELRQHLQHLQPLTAIHSGGQ